MRARDLTWEEHTRFRIHALQDGSVAEVAEDAGLGGRYSIEQPHLGCGRHVAIEVPMEHQCRGRDLVRTPRPVACGEPRSDIAASISRGGVVLGLAVEFLGSVTGRDPTR